VARAPSPAFRGNIGEIGCPSFAALFAAKLGILTLGRDNKAKVCAVPEEQEVKGSN